jgi:Ser/Thr protein kinase RdoA (MazF antagonist)
MLKLRHLFNNLDLTLMLLKHWDYDEDSLDLLQYFRISANAIYPFRQKGEMCLLRFSPTLEKLKTNLLAELEFIVYLRNHGYPALEPVVSRSGELLVEKPTPWGDHYASVFRRVPGEQLSTVSLDEEKLIGYGAALGKLHALSSHFQPGVSRWNYIDVFNWIEEVLRGHAAEKLPLIELELLRQYFQDLPALPANYGLIHYDFELDNVFYEEATETFSAIDFDDAMYHWYMMDVVQALDSLRDETPAQAYPGLKAAFLQGYRSQFPLDEDMVAAEAVFRRFATLYGYTRNIRSLQERWENEPEWMTALRVKLERAAARDAASFGKPVHEKA